LAFLALAPLGGCYGCFDDTEEYSSSWIVGFASDTTAILFKYNWETSESLCGPGNAGSCASSKNYIDIELMLVDVRFHKVYWSSKVSNSYGKSFLTKQWDDSTIFIAYGSDVASMKSYLLWKIGDSKPQKIALNWNTEVINILGPWFRWDNDSILVPEKIIIDTKTRTVNNREAPDCSNYWYWWGKDVGGGCFEVNKDSCNFALLSEKGESLSSFTYSDKCKEFDIYTRRYFIQASLGRCKSSTMACYTYPIEVQYEEAISAYIRYDDKGNIMQKPSFWLYDGDGIGFVDSLNNIVRY
jgi:hypothetical protein